MKNITRIVLTGGPAAGKTTLISRILKEFKQEDGWRVITIPETATDLISGFGIKPFGDCVTMEQFQYYVIADQLHKEQLALKAAQEVPEEKILIIYDRAVLDDKAYISDAQFEKTLAHFGKTEQQLIAGYDAVLHLVTCAKGAEYAYNFGNAARYESVEDARALDDRTLRAWSTHPNVHIIDNSEDFEDKINRGIAAIYSLVGQSAPEDEKRKFLIAMPDAESLVEAYSAVAVDMMQNYLVSTRPNTVRRIRQQRSGGDYLYFYTEKRSGEDGKHWVTERPISQKEYIAYLMESDILMHPVRKTKYRFNFDDRRMEIDIYPFSKDKAILFVYGKDKAELRLPSGLELIKEVTGLAEYKNSALAREQKL
ncbi:MAG: AAA family ATPase [Oscillospiraceae bacterium]|nr:AAA family ATPase [Oscillospiraceae bacterium]